jgi:hypothetical protein
MIANEDLAAQIVKVLDERPMNHTAMCREWKVGARRLHLLLDALQMRGQLVCQSIGHHKVWQTPRLWKAMYGKTTAPETPTVNLPARNEWYLPAAKVTYKDGVKITRHPAPRPRFHVDLPPEGWQISSDWRLRRGA